MLVIPAIVLWKRMLRSLHSSYFGHTKALSIASTSDASFHVTDDPYKTPVEDLSPDQATPIGVNRGTSTPLDALILQQALQRCGGDFE